MQKWLFGILNTCGSSYLSLALKFRVHKLVNLVREAIELEQKLELPLVLDGGLFYLEVCTELPILFNPWFCHEPENFWFPVVLPFITSINLAIFVLFCPVKKPPGDPSQEEAILPDFLPSTSSECSHMDLGYFSLEQMEYILKRVTGDLFTYIFVDSFLHKYFYRRNNERKFEWCKTDFLVIPNCAV